MASQRVIGFGARWVGRAVLLATVVWAVLAVDGLVLADPAPAAVRAGEQATLRQIGTSPANPVVARLPDAVSVTFSGPITERDAQVDVTGPWGPAAQEPVLVVGNALRRDLTQGMPNGEYRVSWRVRGEDGTALSGEFTFVAARGHLGVPPVTASPSAAPTAEPTSEPSEQSSEQPSRQPTVQPTAAVGAGLDRPWFTDGSAASGAVPGARILVPLLVGAMLVLAAAALGFSRERRRRTTSHWG